MPVKIPLGDKRDWIMGLAVILLFAGIYLFPDRKPTLTENIVINIVDVLLYLLLAFILLNVSIRVLKLTNKTNYYLYNRVKAYILGILTLCISIGCISMVVVEIIRIITLQT